MISREPDTDTTGYWRQGDMNVPMSPAPHALLSTQSSYTSLRGNLDELSSTADPQSSTLSSTLGPAWSQQPCRSGRTNLCPSGMND